MEAVRVSKLQVSKDTYLKRKATNKKKSLATSNAPAFTGSLAADFRLNHQLRNLYEWHREVTHGYRGHYTHTLCMFNIIFV